MKKTLYKSEIKCYNKRGKLHNDSGPARIIFVIKRRIPIPIAQEWYKNGKRHRLDGPATIVFWRGNGKLKERSWFVNGQRHRVDGPAMEYNSMYGVLINSFYKDGVLYNSKEEWFEDLSDKEKLYFILKG